MEIDAWVQILPVRINKSKEKNDNAIQWQQGGTQNNQEGGSNFEPNLMSIDFNRIYLLKAFASW